MNIFDDLRHFFAVYEKYFIFILSNLFKKLFIKQIIKQKMPQIRKYYIKEGTLSILINLSEKTIYRFYIIHNIFIFTHNNAFIYIRNQNSF